MVVHKLGHFAVMLAVLLRNVAMSEAFCCQAGTWESREVSTATGIMIFFRDSSELLWQSLRFCRWLIGSCVRSALCSAGLDLATRAAGDVPAGEDGHLCAHGCLHGQALGGGWDTIQVSIGILPNSKPLQMCQLTYA